MAATTSTMLNLGTLAPVFRLPDTDGAQISLSTAKGEKGTLVLFICNHCPYVLHIVEALVEVAHEALGLKIGVVAINSNDVESYPADSPLKMKELKDKMGFKFPYLFDETQAVAKAYQAACTPDIFLFDSNLKLVYRGQFDDSRPKNSLPVTGKDLRMALKALSQGTAIPEEQKASIGCNIKWKPGNEPRA